MTFKVKSGAAAGPTSLTFGKSIMIDENFADVETDIIDVPNEASTITVQ